MNINEETVRKPSEPKPRPGIHDYCLQCDVNDRNVIMVKYGNETDEESDARSSSNEVKGIDEVDCSRKIKKTKAKKCLQKAYKNRRNSYDFPHENEPSNERLAQSLPTTFPSPLYFSDRWQPPDLPNRSLPLQFENPVQDIRFPQDIQNTSDYNKSVKEKQGIRVFLFLFIFFGLISSMVVKILWVQDEKANITSSVYDGQKFNSELFSLGEQYSINEDSILQIKSGISTIFQNQDAGSFIFVYNSNINSFDKNIFNNFINSIASATARYLRKGSQQVQHIEIEPSKLAIETHSELIQKYREDVSRTGLLLVKDIDKLPSNLAMAFHYYCDEYNPLVKGSAVFFTLDIANCSAPAQQQPNHAYIEKCLANKWSSVPKDNIGPLLTRVVGTIVDTGAGKHLEPRFV